MTTNTGGSAFPCAGNEIAKRQCESVGLQYQAPAGMTLRDYFAAKAMQGLLELTLPEKQQWSNNLTAETAYAIADAMIQKGTK